MLVQTLIRSSGNSYGVSLTLQYPAEHGAYRKQNRYILALDVHSLERETGRLFRVHASSEVFTRQPQAVGTCVCKLN